MPPVVIREGRAVSVPLPQETVYREAINDLQRTVEDLGWTRLNAEPDAGKEQSPDERRENVIRARLWRRESPLMHQAERLLKTYTLGQGVTITPQDHGPVGDVATEFWDNPTNQASFTSRDSMAEFLSNAWCDGDGFLVLFPNTDTGPEGGTLELTTLDALAVVDWVGAPNNWRIPKWWKVKKQARTYDFRNGTYENVADAEFVWYRDWRNADAAAGGKGAPARTKVADGLIYWAPVNRRGKFGESELLSGIAWAKGHRTFMNGRLTLNVAAASVAMKRKVKGGKQQVQDALDRARTRLTSDVGWDTNPANAAGGIAVENEASTLEWFKSDTGGAAADYDERKFRMMTGSSVGVMNHYFGDEAQANLATATAMELPMLKMYEWWQGWLAAIARDLLRFALETANKAGRIPEEDRKAGLRSDAQRVLALIQPMDAEGLTAAIAEADVTVKVTGGGDVSGGPAGGPAGAAAGDAPAAPPRPAPPPPDPAMIAAQFGLLPPATDGSLSWYVDVDFPPIVQKDLTALVQAITLLAAELPGGQESKRLVLGMLLNALGVNDVDKVLERVFLGAAIAAAQNPTPPPPPGPPASGPGLPQGAPVAPHEGGYPPRVRTALRAVREANPAPTAYRAAAGAAVATR